MNTTAKYGKYNDGSSKVQYERHGVQGKSYAGFYMFLVTLISVGTWAAMVIATH